MAKNLPIITAGDDVLKRECKLMSGTVKPGDFVMNAANAAYDEITDKSTGAVAPATANYVAQVAIADLSSINGMGWTVDAPGVVGSDFTYVTGDQIPVLYPTNGVICNVNIDSGATGAVAIGNYLAVGANHGVQVTATADEAIGIAREAIDDVTASTLIPKRIKMEVLK